MSDDPGSKKNGEWQMPDPVFRSSDGFDPRERARADDIPTESPDKEDEDVEIETAEFPAAPDAAPAPPASAEPYRQQSEISSSPTPAAGSGGGCLRTRAHRARAG